MVYPHHSSAKERWESARNTVIVATVSFRIECRYKAGNDNSCKPNFQYNRFVSIISWPG
jgi:hypothetical protein